MSSIIRIGSIWIYGGVSWRRIAVGICIDGLSLSIDLGPFWITIEWWKLFNRKGKKK